MAPVKPNFVPKKPNSNNVNTEQVKVTDTFEDNDIDFNDSENDRVSIADDSFYEGDTYEFNDTAEAEDNTSHLEDTSSFDEASEEFEVEDNTSPVDESSSFDEENEQLEVKKVKPAKRVKASTRNSDKTVRKTKQQIAEDAKLLAEKEKKGNNAKIIGRVISAVIIIILLVILIITIIQIKNQGSKHIVVVDNTAAKASAVKSNEQADTTATVESKLAESKPETGDGVIPDSVKESSNTVELTANTGAYDAKTDVKVPITLNLKLDGEDEYSDHETYLIVELDDMVAGYDKAKELIDEYNTNKEAIVTVPDKDEFYNKSENNELVVFKVNLTIPDDFIVKEAGSKSTFLDPKLTLAVVGTENENQIVADRIVFAVPKVTNLYDSIEDPQIGEKYTYMFLTTLPEGANEDTYKLRLNIDVTDDNQDIEFKGIEIPKITYEASVSDDNAEDNIEEIK